MKKNKTIIAVCIILAVVIPVAILAACLAGGGAEDDSGVSIQTSLPPFSLPGGLAESGPAAASVPAQSVPQLSQAPSEAEASSVLQTQPAPVFTEEPTVSRSGAVVTVTFKTDVSSAVNVVLATSNAAPGVRGFYDYFNRGQANADAVSKHALYNVTSAGKSLSITLPDLGRNFYLWVNAAEDATGTWQSGVKVIGVYTTEAAAPLFVTTPYLQENTADNYTLKVEMMMPATVYALVTGPNDPAPSATQILDPAGYTGTVYARANVATSAAAPFHGLLSIPKGGLAAGNYKIWFAAASTVYSNAPLSDVTYTNMGI